MIRGIHYFSAEVKMKIDVIPRGCFKMVWINVRWTGNVLQSDNNPNKVVLFSLSLLICIFTAVYTFAFDKNIVCSPQSVRARISNRVSVGVI